MRKGPPRNLSVNHDGGDFDECDYRGASQSHNGYAKAGHPESTVEPARPDDGLV
jgi:hypothetical protein